MWLLYVISFFWHSYLGPYLGFVVPGKHRSYEPKHTGHVREPDAGMSILGGE